MTRTERKALSIQKLRIALSPTGPMQLSVTGPKERADYLNAALPRGYEPFKPQDVNRWLTNGFTLLKKGNQLESLCRAIKRLNPGVTVSPNDFVEPSVTLEEFAQKVTLDPVQISRCLTAFLLNSDVQTGEVFANLPGDNMTTSAQVKGIYVVNRYLPPAHDVAGEPILTSTCLLIIDEPIPWLKPGRSAPFVTLIVPTKIEGHEHARYTGLYHTDEDLIYLRLGADFAIPHIKDMCQLTLKPNNKNTFKKLSGYYVSSSIENMSGNEPDLRLVEATRKTSKVTKAQLDKLLPRVTVA